MEKEKYTTVEEYFSKLPSETAQIMQAVRQTIKENAPQATEKIAWNMPTFYMNGNLVHYFAHKNHVGVYPGASGIEHFSIEFDQQGYKYSKGAVQFPFKKPMPLELIARITKFRVEQNKN